MKVPCGGFDLDESVFNVDKNSKRVKLNSPISYDYMPEGYPSKSVGTITLMEEQEVTFADKGGHMMANSSVVLNIELGEKLTVVWDGVSYDVIVKTLGGGPSGALAFGNISLIGLEDTEDYPFVCTIYSSVAKWTAADTATTHTIKVMRQQVTITPMSADFMPVVDGVIISSSTADSTKKFKITVNDSGTISATEIT